MAILVTGGAGYIGAATVYALMESGYTDLVVADNLSLGHRAAVHPAARFYQTDICDRAALRELFRRETIEGVIHFAAYSQVGESMTQPLKYYANNVGGTECLLSVMIEAGVKHIVFSSTAAVYGEPDFVPILESALTVPTNCYGETKLVMESMMAQAARAYHLRYVALRYFNAAGAHPSGKIGEDHRPETHLIPLVLQVPNALRESVSVFGTDYPTRDGTCVRDYIHVTDLAAAHVLALKYLLDGGKSDVFNLGNGIGFTVQEVIETARRVTKHPIPAIAAKKRAGDPAQLIASSERAKTILGWNPQHAALDTIIESAWNWHKTHPNGYGD